MKPEGSLAATGVLAAAVVYAAAGFEAAPTFKASQLLAPGLLKGKHHSVDEPVSLAGLYRKYRIKSDYGEFEATGDAQLVTRLKEVDALGRLAETSQAEVALKAVGATLGGAAKGAAHAVSKPGETVAGIPGGVGKMFGRVGRSAKRTAEKGEESVKNDEGQAEAKSAGAAAADATGSAAKGVLGISAGRRRWAKELGVDPYTSNAVLGEALDKVGQVDAAGRFATKLVPGVGALSMVASVNALVYEKSPDELMKYIEDHLKAMGVPAQASRDLRLNKNIRPGVQARIVAALDALSGVADRAAFVERAAAVSSETGALYYAEGAEMLERFHRTQAPLARIVPAQAAAIALTKDGRLVHLLPADYVAFTQPVAQAVDGAARRAKEDFASAKPEVWITGEASARVKQELGSRGWALQQRSLRAAGPLPASAGK